MIANMSALKTLNHHWLPKLILVALIAVALPGCVSRMFYYPDRVMYRTPESMGPGTREVFFESLDGTRLHGWFTPASTQPARGTVVQFHGNAQNLTAHSGFVDWLPAEGYNLFLFDYRGYGKSEGNPSRQGLFEDGVAALRLVRTFPEVDTNRIAIIGQSLGGTIALAVAGRHPELRGQTLIIDSAFYSYRQIVRDKIKEMPLLSMLRVPLSYWLTNDDLSPHATIADIAPVPILFIHGTDDLVIPHQHTEMLHAAARDPKKLILIPGGHHLGALQDHHEEIIPQVLAFLGDESGIF